MSFRTKEQHFGANDLQNIQFSVAVDMVWILFYTCYNNATICEHPLAPTASMLFPYKEIMPKSGSRWSYLLTPACTPSFYDDSKLLDDRCGQKWSIWSRIVQKWVCIGKHLLTPPCTRLHPQLLWWFKTTKSCHKLSKIFRKWVYINTGLHPLAPAASIIIQNN